MGAQLNLKQNGWIWQVTVFSIILGMLIASSIKARQIITRTSGIPSTRFSGVAAALLDEKDKNKTLQKEITDLRTKVDKYEQVAGEGSSGAQLLRNELQKAKFFAGLVQAEGPGVEVVLRDSTKSIPADSEPELMDEYIIHDLDLRNFVNELFANSAEAVAISNRDSSQRIIASTPIRCDAGVIRVNRVPMAPPFTITAIGPPLTLKNALEMRNGIISQFRFIEGITSGMVKVRARNHITIPAYSGSTSFIYASFSD